MYESQKVLVRWMYVLESESVGSFDVCMRVRKCWFVGCMYESQKVLVRCSVDVCMRVRRCWFVGWSFYVVSCLTAASNASDRTTILPGTIALARAW
jgi:hypothetical protein